ncbi:MAG TPA: hypothetical protein VK097_14225 [Lentibacillus sp.]|uniref:hypothetical protein n=1 Tax=Lentibacillus sp. TaxID=1925746 RepID=UPI002B4B376A|nr:hypothetical protein [Lentibacillus sp.]HLR63568.1 hypothetical protein [Lentibacillus sp.]
MNLQSSGEKLPYLGRHYLLKVHRETVVHVSLTFYQNRFIAAAPLNWSQEQVQEALKDQFIQWYRQQADSRGLTVWGCIVSVIAGQLL